MSANESLFEFIDILRGVKNSVGNVNEVHCDGNDVNTVNNHVNDCTQVVVFETRPFFETRFLCLRSTCFWYACLGTGPGDIFFSTYTKCAFQTVGQIENAL